MQSINPFYLKYIWSPLVLFGQSDTRPFQFSFQLQNPTPKQDPFAAYISVRNVTTPRACSQVFHSNGGFWEFEYSLSENILFSVVRSLNCFLPAFSRSQILFRMLRRSLGHHALIVHTSLILRLACLIMMSVTRAWLTNGYCNNHSQWQGQTM